MSLRLNTEPIWSSENVDLPPEKKRVAQTIEKIVDPPCPKIDNPFIKNPVKEFMFQNWTYLFIWKCFTCTALSVTSFLCTTVNVTLLFVLEGLLRYDDVKKATVDTSHREVKMQNILSITALKYYMITVV